MFQFNCGSATDIGRKRSQNQDSYLVKPELGLFLVADGMGGHRGGETASSTAVEVVASFVHQAVRRPKWDPKKVIVGSLEAANEAIYDKALKDAELQGMGTTATALLFQDQTLTIGHVGDSRCYFLRPSAIWQATRDHSLVQEKLRAGLITRSELKTDKMKNVITRSVGFERNVNVELYQMEVQDGDCFLVCSDGLTGLVDDSLILEIIQKHFFEKGNLQTAVDELIQAANDAGGDDNISIILVQPSALSN